MPFAFNDDRSLLDIVVISNINDDTGLSVSSESFSTKQYDQTALAAMGISDINDYIVIGKMFGYEDDGLVDTWRTEWSWTVDTHYPESGIDVVFLDHNMNVEITNDRADDLVFRFKIALLKVS